MLCLSDQQTMAFKDQSTIPKATFIEIIYIYNRHAVGLAGSKVQVTFHRSREQVTVPPINYQSTQIPLDLIEHFVKRLGIGDS